MQLFGAVDVGGTSIKAAVVDAAGGIHFRNSLPSDAEEGRDAVLGRIIRSIHTLERECPELAAIGVGMPGVIDQTEGCIHYPPNLPGWDVFPIRASLRAASNNTVFVDNDAHVAGLGEAYIGAGKGHSHFLYITLGTGIGGAIISGGRVYHGERGGAAEIGHIIVHADAAPPSGSPGWRAGVLEEYVGRHGLIAFVRAYCKAHPGTSRLEEQEHFDVAEISAAAWKEDPAALACFRQAGTLLGTALASALNLLDTRLVVVGGGISQAHPLLLETARSSLKERVLPAIASQAEIRPARFGSDAGIIGAAMLAKLESAT